MASAALDRLLHRSTVINIRGDSYRLKEKRQANSSHAAIEATGHWYWMVDEMEKAGHHPHLANPVEAKKRMGKTNKTDALDAKGLAILLHNGTLPESWIPPHRCAQLCAASQPHSATPAIHASPRLHDPCVIVAPLRQPIQMGSLDAYIATATT